MREAGQDEYNRGKYDKNCLNLVLLVREKYSCAEKEKEITKGRDVPKQDVRSEKAMNWMKQGK